MNIQEYIASGIIDLYVLGHLSDEEACEVTRLAGLYPEIRTEIEAVSDTLQAYAEAATAPPHPSVKPFLMAVIDYTERLKKGENPGLPALLNENSTAADYSEWLDRSELEAPAGFEHIFARLIGYTPDVQTAIVWIRNMAPHEVHHDTHEKFLILEGSCDVIVGDETISLHPGDYFSVPLHAGHELKITSSVPCKAILQRVAA